MTPLFCNFKTSFFTAWVSFSERRLALAIVGAWLLVSILLNNLVHVLAGFVCGDTILGYIYTKSLIKLGILLLTTKLIDSLNVLNLFEHDVKGSIIILCWAIY